MRKILVVGLLAAAVVFVLTVPGTARADNPVPKVAHCSQDGGYISDGHIGGTESNEDASNDCEGSALLCFFLGFGCITIEPVCLGGQNYRFGTDDQRDWKLTRENFLSQGLLNANLGVCPPPSSIFLCYSKSQGDPDPFGGDQAPDLLAQGYWLPYAIAGNVDGGTNIGDFHLTCNLSGTQKPTGVLIDGAGTDQTAYKDVLTGLYPVAA